MTVIKFLYACFYRVIICKFLKSFKSFRLRIVNALEQGYYIAMQRETPMNEVETKVHQHDITLARLEVLIEQNERRFDATDRKIDNLNSNTAARFDVLERRLDNLDRRMNWFLGLLSTSWLSIIGLIFIKLQ